MTIHVTLWRVALTRGVVATIEVLQSRPGLLEEAAASASSSPGAEKSSPRRERPLFILFPGNPGYVHFYKTFVAVLANEDFDVLVAGFAGHSHTEINGGQVFVLQDQIEVADRFLGVFEAAAIACERKVFIGGHSIGAFVALHVLARHSFITKAFLLTPTICNMEKSPNGIRNKKFLNKALISAASHVAVPILSRLPGAVKHYLLRFFSPDLDVHGRDLAIQMARPHMAQNILLLAQSEFQQVASLDVVLLQAHQQRVVGYFVLHDGWVPLSDVELIRKAAPLAAAMLLDEDATVPHAWCLNHSKEVVQRAILPFVQ